jgi:hypothetical protein
VSAALAVFAGGLGGAVTFVLVHQWLWPLPEPWRSGAAAVLALLWPLTLLVLLAFWAVEGLRRRG